MTANDGMPEIERGISEHAVSVYGESVNACEDFPVLKAFQQYIDAEQAKARKRMILLCVFFGGLMFVVISVFVCLLVSAGSRNQMLNDRLIEYVIKDRDQRSGSAVVVQPPQDTSIILSMTAKLEELQKKLVESQASAAQIASNAAARAEQRAIEAVAKKGPTPEELEISRLKALLVAEREKQEEAERKRKHDAEIEEYRRKHYPELYEQPKRKTLELPKVIPQEKPTEEYHDELLKEVDEILSENEAISYFDEDEERLQEQQPPSTRTASPKDYSIPVDIRGSSNRWSVPND